LTRYYIFENWHRKRGRIHFASCSYCNDGRGTQQEDGGEKEGTGHSTGMKRLLLSSAFKRSADIQPCAV
jgi:hypothetical protein